MIPVSFETIDYNLLETLKERPVNNKSKRIVYLDLIEISGQKYYAVSIDDEGGLAFINRDVAEKYYERILN